MNRLHREIEAIESSSVVRTIRVVLVEDATWIFGIFGTLSIGIAVIRNLQSGITPWMNYVPSAALLVLMGMHLAKRWVPASVRSVYLVVALLLVSANGFLCMGSGSQSAFWVPLAVVIAWATLKDRDFRVVAAWAMAIFVFCMLFVVLHGQLVTPSRLDPSRIPTYWVNLLIVHAIFGAMGFQAVRRIVNALADRDAQTRADRDRLAGILEGIQDAVIVLDPTTGQILDSNPAATAMFGYSASELSVATYAKLCTSGGALSAEMSMEHFRLAEFQGSHQFTWKHRRGDASVFWAEVYAKVFLVGDGKRLLLSIRDIDERIHRHKDLEKLNQVLEARVGERTEKLELARKELQTFSYAVSHDLRAPLRAATGFAQALQEDYAQVLDERGKQAIDRIVAGSQRMSRLIEALLDLSRIDRAGCASESVDMEALARECAGKFADSSKADTTVRFDSLPACTTDPDFMRQVCSHLLSNAFKFSASVDRPAIEVGHEVRDDGIWYTVSDNGGGFEMDHAHKLFILFHRLHGASVEGEGIGLAVVKRILDRLGGAIEAHGVVGHGAVFKFRPGPAVSKT